LGMTVLRKRVFRVAKQMFGVTKQIERIQLKALDQKGGKAYFKGNTTNNFVKAKLKKSIVNLDLLYYYLHTQCS